MDPASTGLGLDLGWIWLDLDGSGCLNSEPARGFVEPWSSVAASPAKSKQREKADDDDVDVDLL